MPGLRIGAYWGARQESAEACAGRLAMTLQMLGDVDASLGTWFHQAPSRKAANRLVDRSPRGLSDFLQTGQRQAGSDRSVDGAAGYRVGLWNGNDGASTSILVGCGIHSKVIVNAVVLSLPALKRESATLYLPSRLRAILIALIDAWEPDWANCVSDELQTIQSPAPRSPVLGWLTYLGAGRPAPESVVGGVVEPLGLGHLIQLGGRPVDLAAQVVVRARLDLARHGALDPTP